MKKLFILLITVTFFAVVLSGCSNKGEENDSGFDPYMEIAVCSREDGSGTRSAFIDLVGIEQLDSDGNKVDFTTVEANITNSTAVMLTTVATSPYAIGYCSLGSLNDSVKALTIDGVEPTGENVKSGAYKISRPFNIVTRDNLSPLAEDFIEYIMSKEGQAIVEKSGYIPVWDGGPFEGGNPGGKLVIAGSSSVSPVMEKLTEAYRNINPNCTIEIQESDSTTGIQNIEAGICDIGMSSRELKPDEMTATATAIAMDGIVVIVNKECPLDNLEKDMVQKIYTGEATLWSEIIE